MNMKKELCNKNNISLYHLPNCYAKDYEYLLNILKNYSKIKVDEEEQLTLF